MKKQLKKGFTLVELVIVIAVIAILAAVLIPTFAGVIDKSKKSAALQEATSANTAMVIASDGTPIAGSYIKVAPKAEALHTAVDGYWFLVGDNGELTSVKKAPTTIAAGAATAADTDFFVINNKTLVAAAGEELAKDLSAKVTVYVTYKLKTSVASFNGLIVNVAITIA